MIKEKMSEIINGQGRDLFRNISFGNSTVGDSGCGAIAVHNAFLLLGKASNFLDTLAWFEEKSSFRTFDVFPWDIDDYLDAQGIQYESSCSASLMNNVEAGGVIIGVITTKCGLSNGPVGRVGDCRSGEKWLRSDCQHSESRRPFELPA